MEILDLLESRGIDYEAKGGMEISITCPHQHLHAGGIDGRPSFQINLEKQVGHCWSCGFKLNQAGMHRWLLGEELDEMQSLGLGLRGILSRMNKTESVPVVEEDQSVFFPSGEVWDEDGYRGISLETYRRVGAIRCSRGRFQGRIVFPVYLHGELIGVDARALGDEQPKWLRNKNSQAKTKWLANFDIIKVMKPRMILLGEGHFHAVNGLDKGYAASCLFGVHNWSASKIMLLLSLGAEEICFFPDCDKAGFQAAQKICASLMPWFKVTCADASIYYGTGKDMGDLTQEEMDDAVARRGTIKLPTCLLENWEFKIEFGAECKKWKCPFNAKGKCGNELYEPEIREAK